MTIDYTGVAPGSFNNKIVGPSVGVPVTAASVGLVAQSAADQDKYLYDGINAILAAAYTVTVYPVALTPVGTGGGALQTFSTFDGNFHNSTVTIVDLADAQAGDKIEVRLIMDGQGTAVSSDFELRLRGFEDFGGAGTEREIVGALWYTRTSSRIQFSLAGTRTIVTPGPFRVLLQAKIGESGASFYDYGTGSLIATKYHLGLS